jgi:hypothetical protein
MISYAETTNKKKLPLHNLAWRGIEKATDLEGISLF